jgi:putative lipase involved disintegration of autophagic bodies
MEVSAEKQKYVSNILDAKKTFYVKKWQSNNYYPIKKYVWVDSENTWEEFVQKGNGWLSWGLVRHPLGGTPQSWIGYSFERMSVILSFNEMRDNYNYNEK